MLRLNRKRALITFVVAAAILSGAYKVWVDFREPGQAVGLNVRYNVEDPTINCVIIQIVFHKIHYVWFQRVTVPLVWEDLEPYDIMDGPLKVDYTGPVLVGQKVCGWENEIHFRYKPDDYVF